MTFWKSRLSQSSRSRSLLPIVVGSACFILGSGAIAWADWLPQGHIYAIGDPSSPGVTAKVTSAGELMATDPGTQTRLDTLNTKLEPLSIDASGSLAVSVQGTAEVTGNVTIQNLPATQEVSGSVTVANMPAVMPVSGAVTVTNLPDVVDVNVTNGSLDLQPTDTAHDQGLFSLHNDGKTIQEFAQYAEGYACQQEPCQPPEVLSSPRFHNVPMPGAADRHLTLVSINTQDNVALVCTLDHQIILRMHVSSNTMRELVRPLKVSACFLACMEDMNLLEPWNSKKCEGSFSIAGVD
jgi:hypothetical protein